MKRKWTSRSSTLFPIDWDLGPGDTRDAWANFLELGAFLMRLEYDHVPAKNTLAPMLSMQPPGATKLVADLSAHDLATLIPRLRESADRIRYEHAGSTDYAEGRQSGIDRRTGVDESR